MDEVGMKRGHAAKLKQHMRKVFGDQAYRNWGAQSEGSLYVPSEGTPSEIGDPTEFGHASSNLHSPMRDSASQRGYADHHIAAIESNGGPPTEMPPRRYEASIASSPMLDMLEAEAVQLDREESRAFTQAQVFRACCSRSLFLFLYLLIACLVFLSLTSFSTSNLSAGGMIGNVKRSVA